jgi:hypothetical protein
MLQVQKVLVATRRFLHRHQMLIAAEADRVTEHFVLKQPP